MSTGMTWIPSVNPDFYVLDLSQLGVGSGTQGRIRTCINPFWRRGLSRLSYLHLAEAGFEPATCGL